MTAMMDIVTAFYDTQAAKDWKGLRSILADDFRFKGPMSSMDTADAFVASLTGMPFDGVLTDSRFIVDGNMVVRTYTWKMTTPMVVDIPMCEVLEVRDGKMQSSQLYYDSKPHQADIDKDEASAAWVKEARGSGVVRGKDRI